MKILKILFIIILSFAFICIGSQKTLAQTYIGSEQCQACHDSMNTDLGYNIWEEYNKSGHPYKLNAVDGAPPTFPANTSPGVPNAPPAATDWNDYAYMIGGYGWKARFVKNDGRIFTADSSAQYNLETEGWVPYHFGEDKKYDYGCFQCHTTGASEEGSWNNVAADSLGTFSEPGIRCEGCHGPGSDHANDPSNVAPPNQGTDLTIERCGDCHNRGGKTNAIPASGGYIRHHEQFNEMKASKHANFNCGTCHDAHIALRYPGAAGDGLEGITTDCGTCHANYEVQLNGAEKQIACEDCHMSAASKSAVGMQVGNGWRGDVSTHIWKIDTRAVTRDSMFTADGKQVRLDENDLAAVTMDFACLQCHEGRTVSWASTNAQDIHTVGIVDVDEDIANLPKHYELDQNYPNPFNPTTVIRFKLPETGKVELTVYNVLGQKIKTLLSGLRPAGKHTVFWDGTNEHYSKVPSGIYVYRMTVNGYTATRKMILMK